MTRWEGGHCPKCGRPIAQKVGEPAKPCPDCTARDDNGDTVTQLLCLRNDELQAENEALAAHVERTTGLLSHVVEQWGRFERGEELSDDDDAERWIAESRAALGESPTTSLARLKDERATAVLKAVAQARREWAREDAVALARRDLANRVIGAHEAADAIRYDYEGEVHQDRIADFVDMFADRLRRQAEEDSQ